MVSQDLKCKLSLGRSIRSFLISMEKVVFASASVGSHIIIMIWLIRSALDKDLSEERKERISGANY